MSDRLLELVTGRFYIDGEPEVRLRTSERTSGDDLLAITTVMGDDDKPVGLTLSVFSSSGLKRSAAETLAKEDIVSRIEAIGGRVISQDVRALPEWPTDITRFVVVSMLEDYVRYF